MVNLIFMSAERYVDMEHKSSILGQKLRAIVILTVIPQSRLSGSKRQTTEDSEEFTIIIGS